MLHYIFSRMLPILKFSYTAAGRSDISLFSRIKSCEKNGEEDNYFSDYKLLLRDGSELFEVRSIDELISDNSQLLSSLRAQCMLDERLYKRYIEPMIRTLAGSVFNAPASHVLHDCDCGGLFSHSILTALLILDSARKFECYEHIHVDYYERVEVFLLILALMHDAGKIVSDYEITTPGKRFVFRPDDIIMDNLASFAQKHRASHLRYHFRPGRSKLHDCIFSTVILQYMKHNSQLRDYLSCVKRKDGSSLNLYRELIEFNDKSVFFDILKSADSRASCASISSFSSTYASGEFLLSLFLSERIDPHLEGFYKLKNGYLVEHGSEAYRALAVALDFYAEIEQKAQSNLNFFSVHSLTDEPLVVKDYRHQSYEISKAYKKKLLGCDYESYERISSDSLLFKRESFFKKLASTGFLIKKGYISCFNWNEVNLNGNKRYVYGFCINTGCNEGEDCYSLVDVEFDRLIKQIKKCIRVDNADNISSFCFSKEMSLNKVISNLGDPDYIDKSIDKKTIKFNLYSSIRAKERLRK